MRLVERVAGARVPTTDAGVDKWAKEIARIKATPEQIRFAIDWLYGPDNEEFRVEVQCGETLRKKWGKVVEAIRRAKHGGEGNGTGKVGRIAQAVRASAERDAGATGRPSAVCEPVDADLHEHPGGASAEADGAGDPLPGATRWGSSS